MGHGSGPTWPGLIPKLHPPTPQSSSLAGGNTFTWLSSPLATTTEPYSQGANMGFRTSSHPRPMAHGHSVIITTVGDLNPEPKTSRNRGSHGRKAQRTGGWDWDTGVSDGQGSASQPPTMVTVGVRGLQLQWIVVSPGEGWTPDPHPVPLVCLGIICGWVPRHPHLAGCELSSDS